jgi:hypothetical protein
MAKKSRRARRQQAPSPSYPLSPTATAQAPQSAAALDNGHVAAVVPAPRKQVDFGSEYRYVINDLRSMAILALAMLAVLIALSFLIR